MDVFFFIFIVACIYGYIANIFKLIIDFNEDGFMKMIRIIGIFFPLVGVFAGLFF